MWSKTSGETMQSRSSASCRCAHAGVIFSPPPLGVSLRGYGMEAIDTTRGYMMQQGSKKKHTVSLTPVKYISPLVSNNYRWGVEIPALHTVSNKPPHPLK